MSNIKQQTTFEKVAINTDDSYAFTPNGSSPYNLNILVSEDGSSGIVTNAKGNKLIEYQIPLTLSKCYETKGSYYNNLTRKAYFFVFSQPYLDLTPSPDEYLYDNRLLCFNEDTLTIDTIFLDIHNWFEIDPAQHLTGIKMLGSWLFFNPVTAQPKMIDVDMAYNYTNYPAWDDTDVSAYANLGDTYTWKGGLFVANTTITAFQDPSTSNTKWDRIGDSYQDESTQGFTEFDKAFFSIKTPPVDRIKTSYASDTTKNFNNVEGITFRFCHRYQYFDNTYSVCSAHSNITLPIDNELYNGQRSGSTTRNNYINLSFSLYSPSLVKNIEIFFQELEGDWKRLTIINRQAQSLLDDVNYTYAFYNNESYSIIDQLIPYVIQDAVPDRVSSQEIINKNVLCYARCREGKPNIDKDLIDVTLTPTIHELESAIFEGTLVRDNVPNDVTYSEVFDDSYPGGMWIYYATINVSAWFGTVSLIAGDVYKLVIDGIVNYKSLEAGNIDTLAHLVNAMVSVAGNYSGSAYVSNDGNSVVIEQKYTYPEITISRLYNSAATAVSFTKYGGFKTQAYHPYCLFYYDLSLRRGDVQITEDCKVYIPSINEYSPPVTGTNYRWGIDWQVNHEPPTWVKYWRWGYAGNMRASYFVQYIVSAIADGDAEVANSVSVDITPLQTVRTTTTADWNAYPNSIIPQYVFTVGDRIRFMTKGTTPATTGTTLGNAVDGIFDFEILFYDATSNKIYVQDFNYATPQFGVNTLVEIYTPRRYDGSLDVTKTLTYYEFGDLMPIALDADGNRVHGGQSQNQSLTVSPLPATGSFNYGDIYHILRTPSKPLCTFDANQKLVGAFHESMWWSDFYKSDDWDRGKLGLESPVGEVTLNIIRYSNVYLQNTTVNGITTFEASHYKELNDVFGKIISIVEVGDTLKCYQEKKPSSILVGRTEYQDTMGSGNVVVSSAVLGAIRYSNTNYGTTFPESISKNNRYVYGYDIYNGVVWRDSANGIFPISGRYSDIGASVDYKMQSYFKAKSKLLLASGVEHCHVLTVWDEEYKMLYVSFKDTVNEANNETVVFHEPSDRWITFTEFEYTPVGGYNQILELTYSVVKGFENGIGYEFDLLTRFAKFNIGGGLGTAANVNLNPLGIGIGSYLGTPTITIGADIAPIGIDMSMGLGWATVVCSYLTLTNNNMSWDSTQYGLSNGVNTTLGVIGVSSAMISFIAGWITVYRDGVAISVGSTVINGDVLKVAPNSINWGIERSSSVVITDSYGDVVTLIVTQLASGTNPTVQVLVDPSTSGLTLYDASGSATAGSAIVNITFTPDDAGSNVGDTYIMGYYVTKNSVFLGQSVFTDLTYDELSNSKTIVMTSLPAGGDTIIVYLSKSV